MGHVVECDILSPPPPPPLLLQVTMDPYDSGTWIPKSVSRKSLPTENIMTKPYLM